MIKFIKENYDIPDEGLIGAEIGVRKGINSRNIFENLNMKYLYCIDPYKNYEHLNGKNDKTTYMGCKPTDYRIAKYNLAKYRFKINFLRLFSDDAHIHIPNNTLDFIYIDGNHEYAYVKRDIDNYYPKVKLGGIIGGHDYHERKKRDDDPVKIAVDEFANGYNYKLFTKLGESDGDCRIARIDWWVVKG